MAADALMDFAIDDEVLPGAADEGETPDLDTTPEGDAANLNADGTPKTDEEVVAETTPVTSLFDATGNKLNPAVKGALEKLKAESPSIAKLLNKAIYRTAELDREFPGGLTEAKELRDKIEELGGVTGIEQHVEVAGEFRKLADLYEAADPAFIDDMIESNPQSFAALAPSMLAKYGEVDPQGFAAHVGRIVFSDMSKAGVPLYMMRLADLIGDNPKAMEAFEVLNNYLGVWKGLAEKSPEAPRTATKQAPKTDDLARREEDLRAREWKTERETLQKTVTDGEYVKALAGRKPDQEERAQIRELFTIRSKAAADRLFPGWAEKAQRFIKTGDKPGYLRYMQSIYKRVVPETMASAVAATLRGKKAVIPPANGQPNGQQKPQQQQNGATSSNGGYAQVAKEPDTWSIDFDRTSSAMLQQNRAVLKGGKMVSWK